MFVNRAFHVFGSRRADGRDRGGGEGVVLALSRQQNNIQQYRYRFRRTARSFIVERSSKVPCNYPENREFFLQFTVRRRRLFVGGL